MKGILKDIFGGVTELCFKYLSIKSIWLDIHHLVEKKFSIGVGEPFSKVEKTIHMKPNGALESSATSTTLILS